ncbi:MAG TPA: hypothetical protein VNU68_21550 [Verrucomicrobiae bacterium]|nr:hypothetical protein [Verrucomicrobiae bacterium]
MLAIAYMFRPPLSMLISRLTGFKGFGVDIVTRDVDAQIEVQQAKRLFDNDVSGLMPQAQDASEPSLMNIDTSPEKAGSLYFFSHDLMLCYCALITGASSDVIHHTLNSAIAHLERIGPGTTYEHRLKKLLREVATRNEADWTEGRRREAAQLVWRMARTVGSFIEGSAAAKRRQGQKSG